VKILLWDIDGTLINNDQAGRHAWLQALAEERGEEIVDEVLVTAGLTDVRIARTAVEGILGRPWDEALAARLLARYVELLPEWLERRTAGHVLPNVTAILEAADARPDVELALLTGNVSDGARLKLTYYGLWHHFPWGAFADNSPDRRDIARFALHTIHERHGPDGVESITVIGDTEHDIDCGKAIGARTIGVGTGPFTAAQLMSHEPWWAVDELPGADEFLARVCG
jgi:phosphoglycolate phosphatase